MQTEELNKALSEIYSDLEKLQSAREQVESVTESSKGLTTATANLLKELREFSNQLGKENSSNISQLTKSLIDFENKINKVYEKGNQLISEYDIPKRLEDIDNKLVNQFNQNKLIKILLILVLSLIGLGGIVAIGLIVKLL